MQYNERSLLLNPETYKKTGLNLIYATFCIVDIFGVFPLIALPHAIIQCGYFAIPLILTVCSIQIYTAILLGRCWLLMENIDPDIRTKHRYPYAALAEATYGKTFGWCTAFLVNLGVFSTSIPNLIVASQNLELLGDKLSNSNFGITYCCWIIIMSAVLCPFLWLGSPKDIKHLSTVSTVVVLLTFFLLSLNIFGVTQSTSNNTTSLETKAPLWQLVIAAYGMLAFQFDLHPTILTIQIDMKNKGNIGKAVVCGYLVSLVLFAIICFGAGTRLGANLQPSILESLTLTNSIHFTAFLVAIQLAMSSVICNNTLYQQIEDTLGLPKDFNWKRCVTRTILTIATVIIAESLPRFDLVMSFMGAAITGPLIFVFPPLFYLKILSIKPRAHFYKVVTIDPRTEEIMMEMISLNDVLYAKKSLIEACFCIIIIFSGVAMTLVSTYYSFATNIQYSTFSPPCICNLTL